MGDLDRFEINFKSLSPAVREYVQEAISENTKRAYLSDLKHFMAGGGTVPATDGMIADYLSDHAGVLSIATLARRVASISKAHTARASTAPPARNWSNPPCGASSALTASPSGV